MRDFDLVIVDDVITSAWQPFTLTRPAAELLFGTMSLRARIERAAGTQARAIVSSAHLVGFEEDNTPPVTADVAVERATLFVLSRFVPKGSFPEADGARTFTAGSTPVAWYVPAGGGKPDFATASGETSPIEGRVLQHVWELMSQNGDQTAADIEALIREEGASELPPGTFGIGQTKLRIGRGVSVDPGVVFDFTSGPIALDDGVSVRAFSRIAGPCWFGRDTVVYGGTHSGVSAGPQCRLRGELEATVVLGYSNKAHDGFIGHAYLGRWVNLGAMTTNSDLKNNYGHVRLWTPADPDTDTGEMKIGAFLGDHVKTGIGALINTGTIVGAGSNLFGGGMPPKYVPPFSWGSGSDLSLYDLEKFIATARTVMKRRNIELSDGMRQVLERAWHYSQSEQKA